DEAPEGVLVIERIADDGDRRTILVNFTDEARTVAAEGRVVVASDGVGEGAAFTGGLAASGAVVIDPTG
ncbi:MAG TPA: DUF3459 domain-containing protein, partial [Acidimicrobiales bacterium]|nr:DUF3459 domain-containing protein [Acidimicrobiales bacterium]